MLTWEKIDAIPGWFTYHSYCIWRALLDHQVGIDGDMFEIGVWRGRSASVLASYRKPNEKIYLCDLRLDLPAVERAIRSVDLEPTNLVPLSGPSADLPGKLDLKAMHDSVRWCHIDGEHTGTVVYRELEIANQIVNTDGIVVVDDFFSPRYPANTTEVIRYLEKNPFHFRLLAVGFNKGYLCRPESLPFYMDYMASGMSKAMSHYGAVCTIFKTTGPWDTDAVGITKYVQDAGDIAGPDDEPQSWEMIRKRPVWGPLRHLRNGWRMLTGR